MNAEGGHLEAEEWKERCPVEDCGKMIRAPYIKGVRTFKAHTMADNMTPCPRSNKPV
ncbi:MAG: hypothetical protein AAB955_03050 [Patescibacteria group bacterium]